MFLGSFEHLAAPWAASRWLRQWGGRSPHVQVSYACVNSSIHPSYILWTSRYTRTTLTATCILLLLLALSMHQFDLHMCLLVLAKYTFNQSQNIFLTVQVLYAVHTMNTMHTMHTMHICILCIHICILCIYAYYAYYAFYAYYAYYAYNTGVPCFLPHWTYHNTAISQLWPVPIPNTCTLQC